MLLRSEKGCLTVIKCRLATAYKNVHDLKYHFSAIFTDGGVQHVKLNLNENSQTSHGSHKDKG